MTDVAVLKFGGSTLLDGASIERACERILTYQAARPVVVVSALQGVTDALFDAFDQARSGSEGPALAGPLRIRHRSVCRQLGLPSDLLDRLWRELRAVLLKVAQRAQEGSPVADEARDQVLSFGERASARIMAAALRDAGVLATPVDSFDLGFETQARPGRSRLSPGVVDRIRPGLQAVPGIPVVTGFLAKDPAGNLTTLGRDGSDWTAAVIAQALEAQALVYWKDVPGVLSGDPRWLANVRVIDRLALCEARELAFQGAQVLHSAALEDSFGQRTQVSIRSMDDPSFRAVAPDGASPLGGPVLGTVLTPGEDRAGAIAIACHPRLVGLEWTASTPSGVQAKLSSALVSLSRRHQVARLVSQSADKATVWLVDDESTQACLSSLPPFRRLGGERASIALIGQDLGQHAGLLRLVWDALDQAQITVYHTSFGLRQHGQAFVIDRERVSEALEICHSKVVGTPLRMAR